MLYALFPTARIFSSAKQFVCSFRFTAGVVHSFTGTAEERDQLLAVPNLYIGNSLDFVDRNLLGCFCQI